jgi:hypothetical protein
MVRPEVPPTAGRRGRPAAAYLAAVATMLAASWAVRAWQDHRLAVAARDATEVPIRLTHLPARIGTWRAMGTDLKMDNKTIQIAGCSDYMSRMYADERTGVVVTALVAYGPAEKIVGHTPAVCFPAVGFEREGGPIDRAIGADGRSAGLRSWVFIKPDPLAKERVNVYAAFRHAGRWTPDSSGSRKRFRHEPGMFKIQIERRIGPRERCDPGNPIEQFSSALIAELERELTEGRTQADRLASPHDVELHAGRLSRASDDSPRGATTLFVSKPSDPVWSDARAQ